MAGFITKDSSFQSMNGTGGHYYDSIIDKYRLHILSDYIVVQPLIYHAKEFLIIDRNTGNIEVKNTLPIVDKAIQRSIHGIIGVINLIAGPYLVVITSKVHVGDINGQAIYKIQTIDMIPYALTLSHLNHHQLKCNAKYLSMIEGLLRTQAFYFSYTYDITHTLQRLQTSSPNFHSMPFLERADPRFVWNRHLLAPLADNRAAARFVLPIIHGFISLNTFNVNGQSLIYGIISRRSTHRAGTRLFIRGIDEDGRVANFVETEQILQLDDVICSYVQTRGSVPCFWVQYPDLRYKPKIKILTSHNHMDAFQHHFEEQEAYYGKQFLISLVNLHGSEGKLNSKYRELYEYSENSYLKFEAFDFHKQCAGMRYDRLAILMARLIGDQDEYKYCAVTKDGSFLAQQTGVFRTNCIDCLDRTNVVQTLLAKRMLEQQLQQYNVIKNGETIDSHQVLSAAFKNIWADHADTISLQYSGTGALKTDYTRTGKRSTKGLLNDGYNSLMRYVLNNFHDGFRQDSMEVFLGNYQVSTNEGTASEPCPISERIDRKLLVLPITMCISFMMLMIHVLLHIFNFTEKRLYLLIWSIIFVLTIILIYLRRYSFVNAPKLNPQVKQYYSSDKNKQI